MRTTEWPNKADAPDPAMTSQFQIGSQWRGVGDPRRLATNTNQTQIMEAILEAILGLLILGAIVGMMFALARKAGYEAGKAVLMAIGMLIPLVNLGIVIYFVSTTWPIQAELASLRAKAGVGSADYADTLMSAALRLESRGDASAAIAKYEEVMRRFPGTDFAKDAEVDIRSLREKIG